METAPKPLWPFFVGGIVMILAVLVASKLLLCWNPAAPDEDAARAAERLKALQELQAENTRRLETYGWTDKAKGQVQIPIQQAMELTIAEMKTVQPHPAGPIATPDAAVASPTPATP